MVRQPDGKILVGGSATDSAGRPAALIARLKHNGSLDPSFGDHGVVVEQFGSGSEPLSRVHALALQPDGKILVATDGLLLVRLDSDGALDPGFGSGGEEFAPAEPSAISPSIHAIAVQPDGRIVVTGTRGVGSVNELIVGRLNENGSLDNSFGSGGLFEQLVRVTSHEDDSGQAIAVQPDGKLLVTGHAGAPSDDELMVLRFNGPDGSLDDSFADHGKLLYDPLGDYCGASHVGYGLVLSPLGRPVIAGGAAGPNCPPPEPRRASLLLRLTSPDGALDTSFGDGGAVFTDMPNGPSSWRALAVQPDDKYVAGGVATDSSGKPEVSIARFDCSGALDRSFADGGMFVDQLSSGSGGSQINALALEPGGHILAAGFADDRAMLLRLAGHGKHGGRHARARCARRRHCMAAKPRRGRGAGRRSVQLSGEC